jgi:hypothetical protein
MPRAACARRRAGCRARAEARQPLAVERPALQQVLATGAALAAFKRAARRAAALHAQGSARAAARRLPRTR